MIKRTHWTDGGVISIKLTENLYTLAQMQKNNLMQFYDIHQETSEWNNVDLTQVSRLFCIYVVDTRIKSLFDQYLDTPTVLSDMRPIEKKMLSFTMDPGPVYGMEFIELSDAYSSCPEHRVIKKNLDPIVDRDIIIQYELCGMIGSPKKLSDRLICWFDTWINWDPAKSVIFPDFILPSRK
jgi:hypothetical protein